MNTFAEADLESTIKLNVLILLETGLLQKAIYKSRSMPSTQHNTDFPHLFLHSSKQVDVHFTEIKADGEKGCHYFLVLLMFCYSSGSGLCPGFFVPSGRKAYPEHFMCQVQPFLPWFVRRERKLYELLLSVLSFFLASSTAHSCLLISPLTWCFIREGVNSSFRKKE